MTSSMASVYILVYGKEGMRGRKLVPLVFATPEDAEQCHKTGNYKPEGIDEHTVDEVREPNLTVQQLTDAIYITFAETL